tara:strand:+ start:75 stop:287 length:213 start_codon:yes stop_codon:yes gene_type:complete
VLAIIFIKLVEKTIYSSKPYCIPAVTDKQGARKQEESFKQNVMKADWDFVRSSIVRDLKLLFCSLIGNTI